MSTNFDIFLQKGGKEVKIMGDALIFSLAFRHNNILILSYLLSDLS